MREAGAHPHVREAGAHPHVREAGAHPHVREAGAHARAHMRKAKNSFNLIQNILLHFLRHSYK